MSQFNTIPSDPFAENQSYNTVQVSGIIDAAQPYTNLQLADGQVICLPTHLLSPLPASEAQVASSASGSRYAEPSATVIPLVEESLIVGKRTVETGKVLLRKTVQEFQQSLDESLAVRTFDVERVVINRTLDAAPAIRSEGNTTVYPVVEERLILTKELILKEEIRVTQRDTERRDTQVVTLQREHIEIERHAAAASSDSTR